jgi:hypothetical protein
VSCDWCGDAHGPERLCGRAHKALTRRSFCFLFGAGMVGLGLGGEPTGIVPQGSILEIYGADGSLWYATEIKPIQSFLDITRLPGLVPVTATFSGVWD